MQQGVAGKGLLPSNNTVSRWQSTSSTCLNTCLHDSLRWRRLGMFSPIVAESSTSNLILYMYAENAS